MPGQKNNKPGIRSYKHLNEVILEILIEKEREMTAREIHYIILDRYSTQKVRINGVKIAKRLKGRENVKIRYGTDGLCHYLYVEERYVYNKPNIKTPQVSTNKEGFNEDQR